MRGVIRALAAVRRRLRPIPRREAAPLALLLLALSSAFVFGNDRSQFYRKGEHNVSIQTLEIAANLSAEHGFLQFRSRSLDRSGEPAYAVYNRFPIGSAALVRLAILPFGDDAPRQIMAARLLMLALFAAAAVLAHLSLARLLGDRRIALAATLLAFSSYCLLFYNDMVSSEVASLFGVMLAFHGMVLFAQEGRFRQLLAKTAVALLLGWHAAALVAAFVLLGLASGARRTRGGGGARPDARRAPGAPARSRYLACGAFAALCCALILGFNLGNEYRALGGEVAPTDLPSVQSLLRRTGADAAQARVVGWPAFLRGQFGAVGQLAIPFALLDRADLSQPHLILGPPPAPAAWLAAAGAALFAACLAGLRFLPHRTLFAALLLTGWAWAIPFRGSAAFHEFEAMFHAGVPLVCFALALLGLRRVLGPRRAARALPAAAVAAAALFALSAWDMSAVGHRAEAAQRQREAAADLRAVRRITEGGSIFLYPSNGALRQMGPVYRLAGRYLQATPIEDWDRVPPLDYALLPADYGGSLTPQNRRVFLYRFDALPNVHASIAAREPALRSGFDLYLDEGERTLTLAREPCTGADTRHALFLHAVPLDAGDLPAERRAEGFEAFRFGFDAHGVRYRDRCFARLALPGYPLAGLRAGQLAGGGLPPVWEASLPVEDSSFPRGAASWYEDVTAAGPAARGPFGVYLEGRALTWAREDCAAADTEAPFFVHAYAADASDLPAERREAGFEALGFAFADRGVRFGDTCMARIALPDYALRSVRTGQYDASGHLWDAEFAPGAEAWLARFDALAAREPDARGAGFALRLEGRTLTLAREGCSAADVADRFFVHAYAPDGSREAIDFWFRQRGERHGDRCLASVELPPSAVRVAAGQYDASGHLWEAVLAIGE